MKKLCIVAALALFWSCANKPQPDDVIDNERFESLYVELLDSASVGPPAISDSTLSPTAERILKRRDVNLKMFRATVRAYQSNPRRWKEFYENVVRRYEQRNENPEK
jgi:hypothetical protein